MILANCARLIVAGALSLGAAVTLNAQTVESPSPIKPTALESFVDGLVLEASKEAHIAGVSVAVVQDGKPVLLKGYGMARQEPLSLVDPERTLFRIGSLSKTLTWITIMQQVEKGLLDLDAPVDTYLPAALQTADQHFKQPIRLVDLMSHGGGYENRDIGRLFATEPAKVPPVAEYLLQNRPARVRPANEVPTYSNYGTQLAAYAAAHVTGNSFEALVKQNLTGPLKLEYTTFSEPFVEHAGPGTAMPPELMANLADGFVWSNGRFRKMPFEHVLVPAAGSASSTAADMASYMITQLSGGELHSVRIYSPETAAVFKEEIFPRPSGNNGWAHGYQTWRLPGGFEGYGHGGATRFFHSSMVLVPELELGIFIASNTASSGSFVRRFAESLVEHFYGQRQAAPPKMVPIVDAERYEGSYVSTRRAYSGLQQALGYIIGAASVTIFEDEYLVTSTNSTKRWMATEKPGEFRAVVGEDRIIFEFDSDGKAVRWLAASGTTAYERVGWSKTPKAMVLTAIVVLLVAAGTLIRMTGKFTPIGTPFSHRWSTNVIYGLSGLWLLVFLAVGLWASDGIASGFSNWPGTSLVFAASAALAAAITAVVLTVLLIPIYRTAAPEASSSWTGGRVVRHTIITLLYLYFAGLLASWGILSPWNY